MTARSGDAAPPDCAPLGQVLRGSAWSLLLRWGLRGIGFFSTIILARLLTPADFGLIALAALPMGLLTALTDFGLGLYVIRLADATRTHCDTAWTIKVLQGFVIAALLVLAAPFVPDFFSEPRLEDLLRLIAIIPALRGLENIGAQLLLRENRFRRDLAFRLAARALGFVATVGLALYWANYWALACGLVITEFLGVAGSYLAHPYRPRPSLSGAREILRFAVSMVVRAVAVFGNSRIDFVIVGRLMATSTVGVYQVSSDMLGMLSTEIAGAVTRGAYPAYGRARHDKRSLSDIFLHSYATVLFICAPAAFGLLVVAEEFILTLLGGQWLDAAPIVRWLAPAALVQSALWVMSSGVLIAMGKEKLSSLSAWIQFGIRAPTVAAGAIYGGAEGAAAAVLLASLLSMPPVMWLLTRTLEMRAADIFRASWRPLLGALAMAAVVAGVSDALSEALSFPPALLAANVLVGSVAYAGLTYLLWHFAGRPEGPEGMVLRHVAARLGVAI